MKIKDIILLIRVDHWFKQIFVLPGVLFATVIEGFQILNFLDLVFGLLSVSFAASANYIINEYLDRSFDKYHPLKKDISRIKKNLTIFQVIPIYLSCTILSLVYPIYNYNKFFIFFLLIFLIAGILYNSQPFRFKDKRYFDTLSEALNNPIRFLLGFAIFSQNIYAIPISIILAYFFGGAFLMNSKRLSEYNFLKKKSIIKKYRKSLASYNQPGDLETLCLAYSALSIFFITVFIIKHQIDFIFFMISLIILFSYFFKKSLLKNSDVQTLEYLYKDIKLVILTLITSLLLILSFIYEIEYLNFLLY